jgi:hypothetical protein
MVSPEDFQRSVSDQDAPPASYPPALKALWHIGKGGDAHWHLAHEIAQDMGDATGCWIHAHLHVIEGDRGNASYWYGRAGRPGKGLTDLSGEFRDLLAHVLGMGEGVS